MKIIKYFNIIIILFLCFFIHFGYDLFPSFLTNIFFPINESIWECIKMLDSSILIVGIVEYFIFKIWNIKYYNYFMSLFITLCFGPFIFLILYIPLFYIFGLTVNIIMLLIVIWLTNNLNFYFLERPFNYKLEGVAIIGIVLIYILFGICTFYPPKGFMALN